MKKNKKLFLIPLLGIVIFGCTRNADVQPQKINGGKHKPIPLKKNGDDDDPILMITVVSNTGTLLSGANVKAINGTDTVAGLTTSNGTDTLALPRLGLWDIYLTRPEYVDRHFSFSMTDSITLQTDTLSHL